MNIKREDMIRGLVEKRGISRERAEAQVELLTGAVARMFGSAPPISDAERAGLMGRAGWTPDDSPMED